MKLRKLPFLLLILVTTLLVSCSDQEVDPFLVGDDNCRIPCWNSIMPGLTTRIDAITRMENLQNKENYSFTEYDIYVTYDAKRVQFRLDETNKLIETIAIDFDDLLLGRMVDLFGEPEYLSFQFESGGCTILLYYPRTGAYFQGKCKSGLLGNHWIVSRNTKINQVLLADPNMEEERLFAFWRRKREAKKQYYEMGWISILSDQTVATRIARSSFTLTPPTKKAKKR